MSGNTNEESGKTTSHPTREVRTPIDDLIHDGALAVGLDPDRARVVSAHVSDDRKLALTLEGPTDAE